MADDTDALLTSWNLALHDKANSTRKLYRECLAAFARTLPDGQGLLEVTRRDVQSYLAGCKAQGLAQATIRSRWIALRSFYAWAASEDELDENPMLTITVERASPPPLDMPADSDLRLLLKACAGKGFAERRDLTMIRTALASGARIGEICGLAVTDIDLANRLVIIRHGKGDKSRVTRVDAETGAALDRYLRVRAKHRLAHLRPCSSPGSGQSAASVPDAMLKRRCAQAGVPPLRWHSFRHRWASEWKRKGGGEGSLQSLGGWTDRGHNATLRPGPRVRPGARGIRPARRRPIGTQ